MFRRGQKLLFTGQEIITGVDYVNKVVIFDEVNPYNRKVYMVLIDGVVRGVDANRVKFVGNILNM